MKTNQLRSLAAIGVLWLVLGAGCKKDPPEPDSIFPLACNDGTCCMSGGSRRYYYVADLDSVETNLLGSYYGQAIGVYFKEPQPKKFNTSFPVTNLKSYVQMIQICELSFDKTVGLKVIPPGIIADTASTYQYRVWGKLYNDPDFATFDATPVYYLHIDRIKANQ
ncbi:hypothetical protein [Spirosoma sp. KNUC1025]|uniref:hypothetical protein n=1 Tax=Spirosoma sp. KNUC1025 TaxID=2894082 RepID=UPI003868BD59|nr:hypothetical protein LN737_24610 [Spirosoma sp. KNUC1025]